MALVKDKNKVFSCGLSVAPVTSWLLYGNQFVICITINFSILKTQYTLKDTWGCQEII